MDGDKIAKIDVLSHNETSGISDPAFEQIPAAIIEAQSADVDVVAGATKTPNADCGREGRAFPGEVSDSKRHRITVPFFVMQFWRKTCKKERVKV